MLTVPATKCQPRTARRGSLWVLFHGSLCIVVFAALLHTLLLGALLSVESDLQTIADAAVHEAILPRANRMSVEQVAVRAATRNGAHLYASDIVLEHNGNIARRKYGVTQGDTFRISVAIPAKDWLPAPLATWCEWVGPNRISAHALIVFGE